ncbi:MAG: glycosyltransferase family 39 protein [Desulfobacterales bacterium]|nr:glycosyltransferase family 39 protein [Desulfobacterales bacterium]
MKTSFKDARQYADYGFNLAQHATFSLERNSPAPKPDSFRSPGYPLLIALSIQAGGDRGFYPLMLYVQAVFGALTVLLTFFLCRRFMPSWASLTAAGLVAICPHLIVMTSYLLTETLFGFLLLAALVCFQSAFAKRGTLFFLFGGILFGSAYLVNEAVLFLPFLLAGLSFGYYYRRREIKSIQQCCVFLGVFLLFPLAWNLRNNLTVPADAPKASDRAVATLSHGAYPNFIYKDPRFFRFPYREDPQQPAFGASFENFRRILWERAKQRPFAYLKWYFIGKPYYLWRWDIIQGVGDVYIYPTATSLYRRSFAADLSRFGIKCLHPLLLILALSGLFLIIAAAWRRENIFSSLPVFLFAGLIYFTFLYMIFAPWPRYSIPLRPELYAAALWSLHSIRTYFRRKGSYE